MLLLVWLRSDASERPLAARSETPSAARESAPDSLRGGSAEKRVETAPDKDRVEAGARSGAPEEASAPAAPPAADDRRAELIVRVVDERTGAAVPEVLVGVHPVVEGQDPFADSEVVQRQLKPWSRGVRVEDIVPVEVQTTESDGRAHFVPSTGVALRLVTFGEYEDDPMASRTLGEGDVGGLDRARWPARLPLAPIAPGEVRAVDFVVPVRERRPLTVTVLEEGAEGRAVAGAEVVLVRRRSTVIAGTGSVSRAGKRDCGTTDAAGKLTFDATRIEDVHGKITADGFGPAFFALAPGSPDALVVRLTEAASVQGQLVDPQGAPVARQRIGAAGHTRDHPWFGGRPEHADQGGDLGWRVRTEHDGRFRFEELPANVPLEFEIAFEDRTLCDAEWPLVLAPGEVREVRWTACFGLVLTGVVLDAEGRPLAERPVWLLRDRETPRGQRYLRGNELEADQVARAARTDLEGRFELDELMPGTYWIALAPGEAGGPKLAVPVRVDQDHLSVELREPQSLTIRGVVSRAGQAASGARIVARPEVGRGEIVAVADANGVFALGPLAPGSFLVRADTASTGEVRAQAGDRDLELTLD